MENAFLEDIAANPDDLAPRLIYADWLSEQRDVALVDRGEFIRLQYALATNAVPPGERPAAFARQRQLLEWYRDQWEEPFRELVRSCAYHRGFAEQVTLDVEHLFAGFEELVGWTPVVRVRLHGLTMATAADVAAVKSLAHLRELDLQREALQAGALAILLASPHLTRLRYLNLTRNALGDAGVRALIRSGVLPQLRYLNLARVGLSTAGLRELLQTLASSPGVALHGLVLWGAPRLARRDIPPLPLTWPFRLRQSIVDQVTGEQMPRPTLLDELHALRTTLPDDLRRWVEWLERHPPAEWGRALTLLPLPVPVHRAFAAVCQRRVLWRAARSRTIPPALPASAERAGTGLAKLVGLLLPLAASAQAEAVALRECLLDLYQRHLRDDLPADGRTREPAPSARRGDDGTLANDAGGR